MVITKRGLVLGTTAIVISTVAVIGLGVRLSQSQTFFRESPKEVVDEVWQIVNRSYVDGTFNQVDWQEVRKDYLSKNYANPEEAYKAVKEMLKKLNDPYTRFMNPEEFKNMQIDTSGELTGVGIQLSKDEKTKELVVISPIEDSPAFKAGILARDVIVKIDGKTTQGMDVNQAVTLIRGKPGTNVNITVKRGQKEINYDLVRAKIQIHTVRSRVQETKEGAIGYIRLNQFSAQATKEMEQAIKELESKQVKGYVLDLRSNPGGLYGVSIDIARMWLEEGTIVSTVDREGERQKETANNTALTNKPVIILVDGGSASASEILSGALQDNKRGTLVGTKTFGKGLVQSVRPLGDGSGLAVTIAKYLTPKGTDINKHGISPDVVFELTQEQRETLQKDSTLIGTEKDPQFVKAEEILLQKITSTAKQ